MTTIHPSDPRAAGTKLDAEQEAPKRPVPSDGGASNASIDRTEPARRAEPMEPPRVGLLRSGRMVQSKRRRPIPLTHKIAGGVMLGSAALAGGAEVLRPEAPPSDDHHHHQRFTARVNLRALEPHVARLVRETGGAADEIRDALKAEIERFNRMHLSHAHHPYRLRSFHPAAPPDASMASVFAPPVALDPGQVVHVNGITIQTYGAVDQAVKAARDALVLQTDRSDIAARLASRRVTIVIVPRSTRMTDLPEFASLRGQRTPDGRAWEDVRGVGGTPTRDGRVVVGIAEEDLAKLPGDEYPVGFSVAQHEIAHVVEDYGLPPEELQAAKDHYNQFMAQMRGNAALADDPEWFGNPRWYGNENYQEHWAMLLNTLTATAQGEGPPVTTLREGASWVWKHDPGTYGDLMKAYPAIYRAIMNGTGIAA